jgi:hypothetical protein
MSTDNYGTFNIGESVESYLEKLGPSPIVSRRNPTVRDKAPIGQLWINRTANTAYFLTQITANQAIWSQAASVAGNLTAGGTITAGTGLVVTAGGATITAGGITVTAGNVAIVAGTLTVSSTITNTLGNITATAGNIVSTLGDFHAVNGNIYTDAGDIFTTVGDIEATLGNITATQGNIVATQGDITATAGDLNMTLGDINMVDGDIIFTAATTGITLPGGPRIVSGAGAPAGAMAQGSLYIRTDGGADTILYVESDGAGTWLAFNTL